MEALGNQVQFLTMPGDPDDPDVQTSALGLDPAFWLVHAPDTPGLRACDLYCVPPSPSEGHDLASTYVDDAVAEALARASNFHVKSTRFALFELAIPVRGWHRISQVWTLRYWKPGEPEGRTHRYEERVWLYGIPGEPAYRIRMPDGCIVDARGVVRP